MQEFKENGFTWERGAVPENLLNHDIIDSTRNVNLSSTFVGVCAEVVSDILPNAFLTRAVLFAKSKQNQWSLGWHQDRVIAVENQHDVNGFEHWTRKGGVCHVEPPLGVLEKMIFVQVYFDDVSEQGGPTELAIGSHCFGKVYRDQKEDIVSNSEKHICEGMMGDVLICHSLILHRSLANKIGSRRRILRLDFANENLSEPLSWQKIKLRP